MLGGVDLKVGIIFHIYSHLASAFALTVSFFSFIHFYVTHIESALFSNTKNLGPICTGIGIMNADLGNFIDKPIDFLQVLDDGERSLFFFALGMVDRT